MMVKYMMFYDRFVSNGGLISISWLDKKKILLQNPLVWWFFHSFKQLQQLYSEFMRKLLKMTEA